MPTTLSTCREAASYEAFAEACPFPVLVLESVGVLSEVTGSFTLDFASGCAQPGEALVLEITPKIPRRHPLQNFITLGRSVKNDLELKVEGVSRFHAYLRPTDEGYVITDAGSRNGTLVNGARLEGAREGHTLRPGDRVQLGSFATLIFHTPESFYQQVQEAA